LEFGILIWGLALGLPIWKIILLAVAYQIGNLFPKTNQPTLLILTFIAIVFYFLGSLYIYLFIIILLLSSILQNIKTLTKSNISTFRKRVFRIGGFIISPIFLWSPILLIILILIFISLLIDDYYRKEIYIFQVPSFVKNFNFDSLIMTIHQIHYFSYVYFIIIIIFQLHHASIYYLGVYITLGWLTYIYMEKVLIKKQYYKYAIYGHSFLFLILGLLSNYYTDFYLLIFLWILTGIGGGTVFSIRYIAKNNKDITEKDIDFSENIGHILGPLLGLGIYKINNDFSNIFIFASLMALLVSILLIIKLNMKSSK